MKQKLLDQLATILSAGYYSDVVIFEDLKRLLLKGYRLSIKQQAVIVQAYRTISQIPKTEILCDTFGLCPSGCYGPMAWAFVIQEGKNILCKGGDRALANKYNDRNIACYFALADCLVKIQQLKMAQRPILITSNSYALGREVSGKWSISKNQNQEQRRMTKEYLRQFPKTKVLTTCKLYTSGVDKLAMEQLKFASMKSINTIQKAA